MTLIFSQRPGRRERHLVRKHDNPLFPDEPPLTSHLLLEAQRLDHEELEAFLADFHQLVHQAVELDANVGSEVVLALKERLDRAYEQAAGLADDQSQVQAAIVRLLGPIMAAVRRGAANDSVALQELEQEALARTTHFELLAQPLVADLLAPDSPIAEAELAATLLSVPQREFSAALTLFDPQQREQLHADCTALLERFGDAAPADALQRLAAIRVTAQ